MQKIDKNTEKWLKEQAAKLPIVGYKAIEHHRMLGIEAKIMCQESEKAEKLQDDKMYRYRFPVHIQVNHFRRMKQAYKDNGLQGVKDYMEKIKKAVEPQN